MLKKSVSIARNVVRAKDDNNNWTSFAIHLKLE